MKRLQILDLLGFEVVPWVKVDNIEENIKELRKTAREKMFLLMESYFHMMILIIVKA